MKGEGETMELYIKRRQAQKILLEAVKTYEKASFKHPVTREMHFRTRS